MAMSLTCCPPPPAPWILKDRQGEFALALSINSCIALDDQREAP